MNKYKTYDANQAYKLQINLCTSLLCNTKKQFFEKLNPSDISDNKRFWKIIKPFFSEKVSSAINIKLCVNGEIHDTDSDIAQDFGNFFSNIVTNLNIPHVGINSNTTTSQSDPIMIAIAKYDNHPSILKIRQHIGENLSFSFSSVTEDIVRREIYRLVNSKATPITSIPSTIIKDHCDIFAKKIHIDFNTSIADGVFPCNLKYADVSPIFKTGDRLVRSNYRPVSILPAISKIFERLYYNQINEYIDPFLSIYQCGFRKNMNAQNYLLFLIEKWKKCLDKKGSCGVLLTDLSKAFDCLLHDLLISKLNVYGFDLISLKLIYNFISKRFQRVRVNSCYSSWFEILSGVPQGSILGPLIFNIDIADLFLFCTESLISNYADDNSPFLCENDNDSVLLNLTKDSKSLLEWFTLNGFMANPDKFHFISSSFDIISFLQIDQYQIYKSKCEKLLGIKVDHKLTFEDHVSSICCKAAQKLHALARVSHFMTAPQRRPIMKAFFNSQFRYCPLVWMFHSRKLNNRINNLHERALRLVFNDYSSSFQTLLMKDNSVTIHTRNIHTLATELYKVAKGLSPKIMKHVFPLKESTRYPTRHIFQSRNVHTSSFGINSLAHLGPKIWAILPEDLKGLTSLEMFKQRVKQWNPTNCPCKFCVPYVAGLGYLT